jgi:hypothetical protein
MANKRTSRTMQRILHGTMEQVKQTAVNWLVSQLKGVYESDYLNKLIEQAKEMEKEQIIKSFDDGYAKCGITHNAQEYYNETFKSE